jgi:ferredoxin
VTFADSLGGASNLSAGCAMPPPLSVLSAFGIDLSVETGEVRRELGIAELPDRLIGEANFRLMDAAQSTGLPWRKMEKFIDAEKCIEGCGDCMLGCRRGAKWTARAWVDEAVRFGAELKLGTRVDRILCEGGSAVGVEGKRFGRTFRYRGKAVVLPAGGHPGGRERVLLRLATIRRRRRTRDEHVQRPSDGGGDHRPL